MLDAACCGDGAGTTPLFTACAAAAAPAAEDEALLRLLGDCRHQLGVRSTTALETAVGAPFTAAAGVGFALAEREEALTEGDDAGARATASVATQALVVMAALTPLCGAAVTAGVDNVIPAAAAPSCCFLSAEDDIDRTSTSCAAATDVTPAELLPAFPMAAVTALTFLPPILVGRPGGSFARAAVDDAVATLTAVASIAAARGTAAAEDEAEEGADAGLLFLASASATHGTLVCDVKSVLTSSAAGGHCLPDLTPGAVAVEGDVTLSNLTLRSDLTAAVEEEVVLVVDGPPRFPRKTIPLTPSTSPSSSFSSRSSSSSLSKLS